MPNVPSSPVITNAGATASVAQYGAPVTLSPSVTVTDPGSTTLTGATIAVTSGFSFGDTLSADTTGTAITASYDSTTGLLTLTGTDTLANYQAVLRSVRFYASAVTTPAGAADTARTIQWQVSDPSNTHSAAATTAVTVSKTATSGTVADYTLNPLPGSVELNPDLFTVKLIGHVPLINGGLIDFSASGDLTGDGNPEIVISGWDSQSNGTSTPNSVPIYLFSALPGGTVMDNASALLGTGTDNGTAIIRIVDFNGDGKNDLVIVGHNESPIVPTQGIEFLSNSSGGFTIYYPDPKTAAHEGEIGDINGDGKPDMVLSTYAASQAGIAPVFFTGNYQPTGLYLWINQGDGTFKPLPVAYSVPIDQLVATNEPTQVLLGGSASYIADLNGDGKPEIIVVDGKTAAENNFQDNTNYIISNLTLGANNAYGTYTELPTPYFNTAQFDSIPSLFPSKTHNIQISVMDIDGDGRPDILIDEMLWSSNLNQDVSVVQILHNDGNLHFTDITNQVLYNDYLSKNDGGHETRLIDVNGDGFLDIVMPGDAAAGPTKSGDGSNYESLAASWSNDILINTGTGKFVSVATDTFHQLTLDENAIFQAGGYGGSAQPYSLVDVREFPYVLSDGTIGFVSEQSGWVSGVGESAFFFDTRGKISTGPGGTNPALQGAPGFNEAYYLTQYPDVAAAVSAGTYASGLAQYLAVGRAAGNHPFASNATVQGSDLNDTIVLRGNGTAKESAGNDTISGGIGADAGSNQMVYSGNRSAYTITRSGLTTTVIKPNGTDTLTNVQHLVFADQMVTIGTAPRSDFNGDGNSDILWQNDSGQAAIWTMNGAAIQSGSGFVGGNPGPSWHVIGSGDFDGNGKSDILWQNDSGQAAIWFMNGTSVVSGSGYAGNNPGTTWKIIGTGDFDGDGHSDILWQNTTTGQAAVWFMNGTSVLAGSGYAGNAPGTAWKVIGTGDFNGDGKADILWQNQTTGQAAVWFMNGTSVLSGSGYAGNAPGTAWKVVGTGDFDGDGKSDILWQNTTTGQAAIWFMNGTGVQAGSGYVGNAPGTDWQIVGAEDLNGDGKSDILWQNTNGQSAVWLMSGTSVLSGSGYVGNNPGTPWHIVAGTGG